MIRDDQVNFKNRSDKTMKSLNPCGCDVVGRYQAMFHDMTVV